MRTALVLLLVVAASALSACDTASDDLTPPPGPPSCGPLTTHSDTLLARVGDTVLYDLDARVERSDLTFAIQSNTTAATVEQQGDRGQLLTVSASQREAGEVVLSASNTCGEIERVMLRVHAVAADADCSVPPSANAFEPQRIALGARPEEIPLWGEGGLFSGSVDAQSTFTRESTPGLEASFWFPGEGEPRRLRLTAQSTASPARVTVVATDICYRTATATLDVEVVDSPVCTLIDPSWVDYLPWETGDVIRMRDLLNNVTEDWTIGSMGACANGARTIAVDVVARPDGGVPSSFVRRIRIVENSICFDLPGYYCLVDPVYGSNKFRPPDAPDPAFYSSGYGGGATFSRARGLVRMSRLYHGGGATGIIVASNWEQL